MFSTIIFIWLFSLSFIPISHSESAITDTGLIKYEQYIEDVLQMLLNDLEENGLCHITMPDFTQHINETMYGLKVIGDLKYSGGIALTLGSSKIKAPPKSRLYNTSEITAIEAILNLDDITIAYDVVGELTTGVQKATGLYLIKGCNFNVTVSNNMKTDVKSVYVSWLDTDGDYFERIKFLPKNDITTVFARKFSLSVPETNQGIKDWSKIFKPHLEKIVTEKIKYPEISFDRNVQYLH